MMWYLKHYDQLTKQELHLIFQERVHVFVVEQNCPYLELDEFDEVAYHLFYQEDSEIRAYLRILPANTRFLEASIGRVMVSKNHRGKGYAKEMMRKAIQFLDEELQENPIRLHAQNYLRQFYASFGFQAISDVFMEDGIPHVAMLRSV